MEEEAVEEVLYEIRHHTTRPFLSNYPPQHQEDSAKRGLFSLLPLLGVNQLKQKWNEYKPPSWRKFKKWTSLFVSPTAQYVAVAAANQITVLQKSDNYKDPCGIFASLSTNATFTHGTWSGFHNVLGAIDDTDTLYFIKPNGEEITRITKKQLKVSGSFIGLVVQGDPDANTSYLCSFSLLTSDGLLHSVEVSQKPQIIRPSANKQFPQNLSCFDYHPQLSLLAIVDSAFGDSGKSIESTGFYCLCLWHITRNLDLEPMFRSPQFEGLFSAPKGYIGPLTTPKVVISPHSKCIAALDLTGGLDVFNLDDKHTSLSVINFDASGNSQMDKFSNGKRKCLNGISDVTWWSDHILIVAKMTGVVSMFDVFSGKTLIEDGPVYSMPVLERVQQLQGCVFLLENTSTEEGNSHSSVGSAAPDMQAESHFTPDRFHLLDFHKLSWSLLSFVEKSVTEMYTFLVENRQYQAALDFADHHGLDRDEVFKSQWFHSAQRTEDVNMFLSNINDQEYVLSECLHKVGPTEEAVKTLLAYGLRITEKYKFLASSKDGQSIHMWDICIARIQLLQLRDRLETFVGMNMGRFTVQEFIKFRTMPLNEAAVSLAESGKIGALNLLFKRHPYSLAPFMLDILAAIPETIPVQTYGQLLPGKYPPTTIALREKDWVECEEVLTVMNTLPRKGSSSISVRTESIIMQSTGFVWPSVVELSLWYKRRARDIDSFSGQLENSLSLLDFALRKGISELQSFKESISYLHQLIYSDDTDEEINITMSLTEWEQLSDYEKFQMMLDRVKEDSIVERLRARALPFMLNRTPLAATASNSITSVHCTLTDSFLVRWLKEIASDNKLDMCSVVIEEGCRDVQVNAIFRDEIEVVECALQCIYLSTLTDRWNTMASILSKLPQIKDTEMYDGSLAGRVKLARGYVEAGRLLAYYQVPKPMNFFLNAHSNEKDVKQILRLVLSKFGRRQPGRSDNDWANMWRDMQLLQEKAFSFLDLEYILMEFCRGLLKAGKFSLARNYLKGTGTVALPTEKAENLVIQSAREYFFSASSLACAEIWKAKECLNLFPSSKNVKAEADMIDALTIKLPNLGVTLLPMQFRQIRDPMEIINMVIRSQIGTYLNVDELLEIAKLLGLSSPDDIAAVQETVAREAAVAGDLQLAFDLCLVLAKKGHGAIWDLCAAIARGPALDNMDVSSRKQLLGFALSHCDELSIGELLHAWKDLDIESQCETLMVSTGTKPRNFSLQGTSIISIPDHEMQDIANLKATSVMLELERVNSVDEELHLENIKKTLSTVAKDLSGENGTSWDSLLGENRKVLSFAALQLPWLLELSKKLEYGKRKIADIEACAGKQDASVRTLAVATILSWLARNDIAPSDYLVCYLAKSIMEAPFSKEEDIRGCSFLLNLLDAFHGVEIIEEQLKAREGYHEVCSIMNMGMTYSSLHNSGNECWSSTKRRELLLQKFQERPTPLTTDAMESMDKVQSTFWREWKSKLAEQKLLTEQSRVLKQIIPGVDASRFLSGDSDYIENVVFSLVDSIKFDKRPNLKELLKLADTYGVNQTEVLLRYFTSTLVSEVWTNEDITAQISEHEEDLLACSAKVIRTISCDVYNAIDGCNKQRLAYIYSILSDCYLRVEGIEDSLLVIDSDSANTSTLRLPQFYRALNQECLRVSFIKHLNFKNLAGFGGLKTESFNDEVYNHINEFTVEALAEMVKTLTAIHDDPVAKGLISWRTVYKHFILDMLKKFLTGTKENGHFSDPDSSQEFIAELEQNYVGIRIYLRSLSQQDVLDVMKQYYKSSLPSQRLPNESASLDCLILLLKFWIRLTDDTEGILCCDTSEGKLILSNLEDLSKGLKVFFSFVMGEKISSNEGWDTVFYYAEHGLSDFTAEAFCFCRAMLSSGCGFEAIDQVFSDSLVWSACSISSILDSEGNADNLNNLSHFYVNILDSLLLDLANESDNRQHLHNLLSSLSKLDGNLEDLKRVRDAVWGRLSIFSDNMQLKGHVRVHTLELMQSITGRNLKGLPPELLSKVQPWEGWDESHFISSDSQRADCSELDQTDASSKFASTLVALKSTRLAAIISSSIEIRPDDLKTLNTAVSCFINLSKDANAVPHFKALQAILEEWEGLFTSRNEEDPSEEASNAGNNWSSEDWDEGWESFQDEQPPSEKEGNKGGSISIHPLHTCWMQIIKRLIAVSQYKDILQLLDHSCAKSNVILLDQDDACSVIHLIAEVDNFAALKVALLLPYEALQFQCLEAVETNLEQGGLVGAMGEDRELFTLILSSGALRTIAVNSAFGTTFSYFCYMAGRFARRCQENELSQLKHGDREGSTTAGDVFFILFGTLLLPSLISELVTIKQPLLAGCLVSRFMHVNPSFGVLNVADAVLRTYLEGHIQLKHGTEPDLGKIEICIYLGNTVSSLRGKLGSSIYTAMSFLSDNVK